MGWMLGSKSMQKSTSLSRCMPVKFIEKTSLNSNSTRIKSIEGDSALTSRAWGKYARKHYPTIILARIYNMILANLDLYITS